MANNSASGGYLQATSPAAAQDHNFDAVLQALVAGVTGLPGNMVRPRWQPTVPLQPPVTTDWCAIGVTQKRGDDVIDMAVKHFPGPGPDGSDGFDQLYDHGEYDVTASFYGPDCQGFCEGFRNGLRIAQNREALGLAGCAYIGTGPVTHVPEFVNQQWINRADVTFQIRREIVSDYAVENVLGAQGTITTERVVEPFTVGANKPPTP